MKRAAFFTTACVAALVANVAQAKLPPPTDAEKAKAAETAARTAWTNSVANYQLCKSMDRVVEHYRAEAKRNAKETKPAAQTASCADPGPFAFTPPRPLEAAGAHSPPQTATQPPNLKQPDAVLKGKKP